jgi:hypothetical protein
MGEHPGAEVSRRRSSRPGTTRDFWQAASPSRTPGTNEARLISITPDPAFDRFIDLNSCASPDPTLQVECRSCPGRLQRATATRRPRCLNRRAGDCPVILSLQNTFSETQAQSRLAVIRQGLGGKGTRWHRAYSDSRPLSSLFPRLPRPIFGGIPGFDVKPACRMPAATPLTSACSAFGDTSVNAKQEGSP